MEKNLIYGTTSMFEWRIIDQSHDFNGYQATTQLVFPKLLFKVAGIKLRVRAVGKL